MTRCPHEWPHEFISSGPEDCDGKVGAGGDRYMRMPSYLMRSFFRRGSASGTADSSAFV